VTFFPTTTATVYPCNNTDFIGFYIGTDRYCWKDSYNPVVVADYMDRLEGLLFQSASLRGFGPDCRTVTLVNTSTVTIILCYCIILLIDIIVSGQYRVLIVVYTLLQYL
jgi:hypothetical protein